MSESAAHSLILEADGKHVLTDCITSFAVVAGLGLVLITGWKPFDPLIAIAVAVNILWSGGRLAWRSAVGLLDYSDPGNRSTDPREARRNLQRTGSVLSWRALPHHGIPESH